MSDPKPFSLAVVRGASQGTVLRTTRKRISVGAAIDNDLVIADAKVAPRHFLVVIDAGHWRIHTLSTDNQITVDRGWVHPTSGRRGAVVRAAGAEIILFPGDLEDAVVARELGLRGPGSEDVMDALSPSIITDVHLKPLEFADEEIANEPTVALHRSNMPPPVSLNAETEDDIDQVEMSQAATVAGDRPPDDLRDAARARLLDERAPVAPSVLREHEESGVLSNQPVRASQAKREDPFEEKTVGVTWEDGKPVVKNIARNLRPEVKATDPAEGSRSGRSAWDRPRRGLDAQDSSVPEILAEPESQMVPVPGGSKSVMRERPRFEAGVPKVEEPAAEVIELDERRARRGNAWGDAGRRTNAWGDPPSKALVPTSQPEPAAPPKNAWGDAVEPAQPAAREPREPREPRGNAWDSASARSAGGVNTPSSGRNAVPRGRALAPRGDFAGHRLSIDGLLRRTHEPALRLLTEPDGELATAIRLLGAKVEELAKNLGYRAYMISSAEPLTGKTTSAVNLAFALAEDTNRRVALVEANFRFPRLSEILGVDERIGTIPVLEGRRQLSESVVKLSDRNLVVLPAGGRHPNPAEVLASPRFKAVVAELVNTVDIAIIDAPAVRSSADANMILPLVDAAFLVVAHRTTRSAWLARAIEQLGAKRVLGALYNTIPKSLAKELAAARSLRSRQSRG